MTLVRASFGLEEAISSGRIWGTRRKWLERHVTDKADLFACTCVAFLGVSGVLLAQYYSSKWGQKIFVHYLQGHLICATPQAGEA